MEERKMVFDYIGQVFTIFGITVMLLVLLGMLFGEEAQGISSLFNLGKEGISMDTLLQFLVVSAATVLLRWVFFSDALIKRMFTVGRTVGMLISIVGVIVVMTLCFDWFPVNMWEPWVMFFLCFGICFVASVGIMYMKEKMENRKMEEALEKLKRTEKAVQTAQKRGKE